MAHGDWSWAYVSAPREELDDAELRVEGALPDDLVGGTLWRNGPGRFERGDAAYKHMLDGDGFVYRVSLLGARSASLKGRFVRTAEYAEEDTADAVRYRGTFGTPKPGGVAANAFDLATKNLSNTHVVAWGGRLLSLYEAGLPCELDPDTLEKLGVGGWAFTAHPHIDPHTDRLCGWAWQSDCQTAPHDFGVTAGAYVFVQNRMDLSPLAFVAGLRGAGECLISRPDLPVRLHVVPRDPALPARVADGPTRSFEIHTAFAHDGPATGPGAATLAPGSFLGEWGSAEPFSFELGGSSLSPDFRNIPATLLWRYEVNAATGEGICIDHPHVNPLYEGKAECRYVYASISNEIARAGPPCGYVRVDVKSGTREVWWAGNRTFCEELVVVPKAGCSVDAEGGESCLLVLDGARLAEGPVARVWLGERLPHGLHGCMQL
eukprot:PRCOL_00006947-RA